MARFSGRAAWEPVPNRLSRAIAEAGGNAPPPIDLTVTNPTSVGFPYPVERIAEALARSAGARYTPDPRGLRSAREAVGEFLGGVSPDDLVLTASTSEAYGFLFKIFGDPGCEVLTPSPSYPLLDHLAALESLGLRHFRAESEGGWHLPAEAAMAAMTDRTRLVVLVHPANPTGAFVSGRDQDALAGLCHARNLPLVSDEVFLDFPLDGAADPAPPAATRTDVLSVSLGGLSKSAALPQMKLGWIRVGGPEREKRRLLSALELVADQWLSVGTPVQGAARTLLSIAPEMAGLVRSRCLRNLAALRRALSGSPALTVPTVEGGWSAPVRIPALGSDEELALDLLSAGVIVHPGYLFDFDGDGWIVLSLLPREADFDEGLTRLVRFFAERHR